MATGAQLQRQLHVRRTPQAMHELRPLKGKGLPRGLCMPGLSQGCCARWPLHIPYTIYHVPYTTHYVPYTIYYIHISYTTYKKYNIPCTLYHILNTMGYDIGILVYLIFWAPSAASHIPSRSRCLPLSGSVDAAGEATEQRLAILGSSLHVSCS